ncbi:hypothetical protein CDEST_10959 [Colletotrichum destructivum]|uniref:Uncharacterized protein n=1 Tax=Colletotrichum destructivum TaxID=34406 RepID=A0AAX4IRQ6_9PEZI|nr:hypothetical protein CDEST_10959 [Colletotrichum destructivum]
MQLTVAALAALASCAAAQFCGVVTSPVQGWVACSVEQYPVMDAECKAIGGTVAGHNQEVGNPSSNCITYCNNVPTGGHDKTGSIAGRLSYHVYVVDSCNSCGYCGAI